ncbi:MAG: CU044_5270 family protein, partial [Mycobacteriales bacterium]
MNPFPRRQEQPVSREELAQLLPAPGGSPLSADRQHLLKEQFMEQIHRAPARQSSVPTPRRRRGRQLAWVGVPGALVALTVAAVAALSVHGDGGSGPSPLTNVMQPHAAVSSAGPNLQRFAATTENLPVPQIRDGQFTFVESVGVESTGPGDSPDNKHKKYTYRADSKRQVWLPVGGIRPGHNGLLKQGGSSTVLSGTDGDTFLSYRDLEKLPTDPDTLLTELRNDVDKKFDFPGGKFGPQADKEIFMHIESIISDTVTPPKVKAALYRATAKIPGVVEVNDAVDGLGRHGIGIAFDEGGERNLWIFDKKTATYLGAATVIEGRGTHT